MNKYDAVVIGSGTGGISAALTLACAGKKVLVIERHNLPGGCSTSFVRGRFEFDAALHEFSGVGEEGKWGPLGKLMMEEYKLPVKWLYSPECYYVTGKTRSGREMTFTMPLGKENAIKAVAEAVPGSEEPMKKFFELCEECYNAYSEFDSTMLDKVDKNGFVKTDSLHYMTHYPNFLKVAELPFNTVLRKIGMPEDAIDILGTYWGYLGADYEKFSFVHQGVMIYQYCEMKPAIIEHNAHGLTVAAVERLRELGGEIWQNVTAYKVTADDNGKITGVDTSVGHVDTNYVIANVNPETAYTHLLDEKIKVPEREMKRISTLKHGVRIFNTYLGLNKSIEELGIDKYTYFINGLDAQKALANSKKFPVGGYLGVIVYNVTNPKISPEGTTMMIFTSIITEDTWKEFSQEEYAKRKDEQFEVNLDLFEKETGIIIRDSIEEIEMASPWTFCHYLNTPEGTCYGYEMNDWNTLVSSLIAIRKDQPIHGFKTCGAAGARGDGFSQTYQSGNDVARLLLEEMKEDGR